jgi:hypothetical protein
MVSRNRADWTRPLPRALVIPKIKTLKTLADVRTLLGHLPQQYRDKSTWRHVAARLDEAARGGEFVDVVVPLRMVLAMEGVKCRPQ